MRKITTLTLLILLWGCTKEIPVITAFDFELEALYTPNVVVNNPQATAFTITPEVVVTTTTYSFKYELTQGSGHFLDEAGSAIPENEWIPVNGLAFTFDYFPETAETHQLTVSVRESSGEFEHSQQLTYQVANNGFTFSAEAGIVEVNVDVPVPVNFNLDQTNEGNVSYTMTFESTGTGTLEYEGVTYGSGDPIPIGTGASSGNYTGTSGGMHEITFTVSNDDTPPLVIEDTLSILIQNFLFELSGFSGADTVFSGATTNLTFDVNETEGQSPMYEMRYVFEQGNAIIRDDTGNVLSPDVYYEVNDPLNGFSWEFEGTDTGTVAVTFYMRNHIGNEESVAFTIEVEQSSDFSINTFVHQDNIYQVGGAGDLCQINYYSRATFTATYVAEGGQLTFVSLIRTDTGAVVDNVPHFLSQGQSRTYNNLADNVEYEVHYTNTVTGENIIKTFVSLVAPPDQHLAPCFPGG